MSNLTTFYANYCGIDPLPPEFPETFIVLPEKPYLTICTGSHTPSRVYDYYQKVLSLLPELKVVQVGAAQDYPVKNAVDYRGRAELRQEAFILKNSSLHIGNEHVFNHIAGAKGIPLVNLHAVLPAKSAQPQFTGEIINIEPERDSKPSYADQEAPKSINQIKPEVVAAAIAELLGIESVKIKTIKIGPNYLEERIDFIPDFPIPVDIFNGRRIVCRYDLCPNKEGLVHFLHAYGGPVFTEDPLDPQILQQLKPRIAHIIYYMDKNYNKDFIHALHYSGIPYDLVTEKRGKELSDLKLDLMDYNQVKTRTWPDLSGFSPDMSFETNRAFLSRGKFYPTAWHWNEGIEVGGDLNLAGFQSKRFQDSWDNLYIFEKVS